MGQRRKKSGISNGYVCICIGREGGAVAVSVNRAKPSADELKEAFRGHLDKETLVIRNDLRLYGASTISRRSF